MITRLLITPLFNDYTQQILDLISPIQQIEFNVSVTLEGQPDLLDIETHYYRTGGGFWGAIIDGELIGTIALINTGHQAGAVRKMFVKKAYRGKDLGAAQLLLQTLLDYCQTKGITEVYLGTVAALQAAHRFYERNGFKRLPRETLPAYFPKMMVDTIFYQLHLDS